MNMQDSNFWRQMGAQQPGQGFNPLADQGGTAGGLFDTALGIYGMRQGAKGNAELLKRAQGPLYQQSMGAAGQALTNAGNMDPKAAAAERYNAWRDLNSGKDAADEQAMMRMLNRKGMLGAAVYNPGVEGIPQSEVAMNPHMAAFYAAQNARNSKAAYDSLNEGEEQIDRQLRRSSGLATQAGNLQNQGLQAVRTQTNPGAKKTNLARGAVSMAKDLGLMDKAGGMLKDGIDWLGTTTGWWGGSAPTGSYDSYGTGDFDLWYD